MRDPLTRRSRLGAATITALVVATALFMRAPVRPAEPPESMRRTLFDEIVREEPAARERARDDWAHHRWSQLDAFGAFEHERVTRLAGEKGLTSQDLLLIVDDGLRSGWPGPDGKPLDVTTVPLKPRAMD